MDATIAIKQNKFSNGMISKHLYGDVSHPKYASSLRNCLNWIPIPQGALVKRPGFKFVAPVKDSSYAPRLVPFFFSDGQTFVLEVGNLYIRFYQRSKYVGVDGNLHAYGDGYGGGYYEVVTPFTTAMLPYLKFSQVGDVVTFTYGGQGSAVAVAPRDLRHTSGALTPWTIGATPLKIPTGVVTWPGAPLDAVPGFQYTGAGTGPLWAKGERAYYADAAVPSNLVEWICIQDNTQGQTRGPPGVPGQAAVGLNAGGVALQGNLWWMPAVDLSHPAIKSTWVQTAVVQENATGVVYESQPSPTLVIDSSLANDRQRPIIPRVATLAGGYTLLFNRFYRGTAGGTFGWVNDVSPGSLSNYANNAANSVWLDDGRAPDYTRQPPQATDPFLVNGVDSYPAVIGYLDQRRLWAASKLLPSSLFLSRAGDLYNYDGTTTRLVPGADTDGMLVTLASEVLEQVRSFVPMRRGLLLTAQGEWAIAGQGGGPVSRNSLDVKRQSRWGSSWLNPIIIGTGVLYNTAKSNMVRDLYPLYGLYADIWDGQDLSVMARDLLDLHTLTDWSYQSTPYSTIWMVRDDGILLSLTYQHAPPSFGQQLTEGIVAWAQHSTGLTDDFESVCCVPEPPEDAVYCGTRRTVNGATVRYIERMNSPILQASPYTGGVPDVRYAGFVDAFTSYDGHNDQLGIPAATATIDSVANPGSANPADYAIGSLVKVTIGGGAPFAASDAANPFGSSFVFDPEDLLALAHAVDANGVAYGAPQGRIVGFTSTSVVSVELAAPMSQAQVTAWRAGQTKWAIGKGQVSATYLLGVPLDSNDANLARGVICLADGDVQPIAAWQAGVAYLNTPAVVIQLGLSYNADVELLDLYLSSMEIRNKFKNVVRMGFEVANTRDMWGGKDLTHLTQLQERNVLDAYATMGLHTGYFELFVTGGSGKSGAAAVRHYQPLPATISAVLREISLGGS